MKKLFAALLALTFTALSASSAQAVSSFATSVRYQYSTGSVTNATWVPLVTSTVKSIKGAYVYNSSTDPMYLGVAAAGATANTETAQVLIPATQAGTFVPLSISQSNRISVISSSRTASTGELDITFLYY